MLSAICSKSWWSLWPARWRSLKWKRKTSRQTRPPHWTAPVLHSLEESASRTTKSSANSASSSERGGRPRAHCGQLVARSPRRSEGHRSRDRNSDPSLHRPLPVEPHRRYEKTQTAANRLSSPLWRLSSLLRPRERDYDRNHRRSPSTRGLSLSQTPCDADSTGSSKIMRVRAAVRVGRC